MLNQVKIQKLNILLVEDDAFSASVISELCRSCDFRVTVRLTPPARPPPTHRPLAPTRQLRSLRSLRSLAFTRLVRGGSGRALTLTLTLTLTQWAGPNPNPNPNPNAVGGP